MRIILAAAAALAVMMVSGCDINTGPAKTAKVDCNCTTPVAAAAPAGMRDDGAVTPAAAPPTYRGRAHHTSHGYADARWRGRSHVWRREYAEISVATYDYHSDSHSYYTDGDADDAHGDDTRGDDTHDRRGFRPVEHGWVDGYGRAHAGGGDGYDEGHRGEARRQDSWHGYDIDCPDDER